MTGADAAGPVGVLVMAHGTPQRREEIAPFYTRIRGGRAPTSEQLAELERRYAAIGGVSPLRERTLAQVEGLRAALALRAPGRYVVAYGAKHTEPSIEEAAATLHAGGARRVIGLVLAPHHSSLGSGEYLVRAEAALEGACPFVAVPHWYEEPALVDLLASRVDDAFASLGARDRADRFVVVFTAHSLPARECDSGDPSRSYPTQLEDSARLVATAAGIVRWRVAWQSAGRTPEPWLEPDVRAVLRQLTNVEGVVVCPIGFVADHLEVLYDLDVELAAVAAQSGLTYVRTASLNDDPRFISVLADVVSAAELRARADPTVNQVVVVGGGISGMAAAWELTGGAMGPGDDAPAVVVMESASRLGGALCSEPFGGRLVDTGPDGFLGRRPEALDLCREIGLDDALVPIARRGAGVWARGRVRPLPDGLALGIPIRFWPTARSGILGLRGQLGLARDVLFPRPDVRGPIGDRSIGPMVARKLGQRVVDRLVDPLIGGIHAGSVDDMSAAATFPPLLSAARKRGSLMRSLRAEVPQPPAGADADAPPLFWALEGGMATLVEGLRHALLTRDVEIRCGTTVERLERHAAGWGVVTGGPHGGESSPGAVVLAVPAPTAGHLLQPHDEEAAALLHSIAYASVTLVTLRIPADALASPLDGTGFLVPRRSARPPGPGGDGWAVTACTFLSQKWPHLAAEGEVLVRASVGRFGDDRASSWSDAELLDRVWDELGSLMGLSGQPRGWMVTRWPQAFPQYRVHHLMRTAGIESAVGRLGGIAVAGAAYRGVGIPACIASGRAAARTVR